MEKYKLLEVQDIFREKFRLNPSVSIKAPGRINIIGEHTDYNLGYVLPAAIDYHIYVGMSKNGTRKTNIYSGDFDQRYEFDLDNLSITGISWLNLVKGVFDQLKDQVEGVDIVLIGDVPVGAGLSSSAALCSATAMALADLFHLPLGRWTLARIAQKSEHIFAGVQCGIMDQFASLFGQKDHVLMLDCNTLDYKPIKVNIEGSRFFLLDSNVKHQLNESEYNARSNESSQALKELKRLFPGINNFRDVSLSDLLGIKEDAIWWKRARHIISENNRVLDIVAGLEKDNFQDVGRILFEGHESLKHDFEITCPETDFIVQELQKENMVYGARQVGGGFGGCVLVFTKDEALNEMVEQVGMKYKSQFNISLRYLPINFSDGCHRI